MMDTNARKLLKMLNGELDRYAAMIDTRNERIDALEDHIEVLEAKLATRDAALHHANARMAAVGKAYER